MNCQWLNLEVEVLTEKEAYHSLVFWLFLLGLIVWYYVLLFLSEPEFKKSQGTAGIYFLKSLTIWSQCGWEVGYTNGK